MRIPVATYRIQLNHTFSFSAARALVSYLYALGVTDLYASPIFKARRGSMHGYDVADPTILNPELGTEEELQALSEELRSHHMGLLLDVVPNHMAASLENPYWVDVLKNGVASPYAKFFDIDWERPEPHLRDRILLPILGAPYGTVLENQELSVGLGRKGFFVSYYESKLPLDPKSYTHLLGLVEEGMAQDDTGWRELTSLSDAVHRLLPRMGVAEAGHAVRRQEEATAIERELWRLHETFLPIRDRLDQVIRKVNGVKGKPESFDALDRLLQEQSYCLAYWRKSSEQMNYRRFFDISELAGVRVEESSVFDTTHTLVQRLVREQTATGLRVDHVDGLADPAQYLRRLQERLAFDTRGGPKGLYVVVEKILGAGEELPNTWPVQGTTGYEFIRAVNAVFLRKRGVERLERSYWKLVGSNRRFQDVRYAKKKLVMKELFGSEMAALTQRLAKLAAEDRKARDVLLSELSRALLEVTACLPVYRTYTRDFDTAAEDRRIIQETVERARLHCPEAHSLALNFLSSVLLLEAAGLSREQRQERLEFVQRWQQCTGPVMAKGLEDTTHYVYNALISLNDVGTDREGADQTAENFHEWNRERCRRQPYGLNATSTHDTKRSEDVRARLNVLSEMPDSWHRCVSRWSGYNSKKKPKLHGRPVPDRNEETFFYQTLAGAWPLFDSEAAAFRKRLSAYLVKAAREAKVHTSWLHPNEAYETAFNAFAVRVLEDSRFLEDFKKFQSRLAFYGALNSLAQVLSKIASPGVPDFYQGTELWDFSLVDPDNRRPIDYESRAAYLKAIRHRAEGVERFQLFEELLSCWKDGRIKLYITHKALEFRRSHADLFLQGDYLPLATSGRKKEHVFSFARCKEGVWAIVAVPRFCSALVREGQFPLGEASWQRNHLVLPPDAPQAWLNLLTGDPVRAQRRGGRQLLYLAEILRHLPVAVLRATKSQSDEAAK